MAHVPVVASEFPEIKQVVQENQIGVTIDPHDSQNIANAVNTLLLDKELYRKYKNNTLEAKKIYNWQNEKVKLLDVYHNLEDHSLFMGKMSTLLK